MAAAAAPGRGGAEVVESSPSGFLVQNEAAIQAAPDTVYACLTHRIPQWWDPGHTFSGDSHNLSLDPRPGGCFCEALPGRGGVRHLTVVCADEGRLLRLVGGLGPLQESGVSGSLSLQLEAAGDGTKMTWTYSVGGFFPGGLDRIAPAVDAVLRGQLLRLKGFVETGRPETDE